MKKANYVVTDFVARNRVSLFSNMSSILFQILIPSKNAPYPMKIELYCLQIMKA